MTDIKTSQIQLSREILTLQPRDRKQLQRFVQHALGLRFSTRPVIAGHACPLDYLVHSFFEESDCIVWANRGGGKTFLGAVATLLDMIFKPGIQIRILGGSLDQSSKMYGYLCQLFERDLFCDLLLADPTQRRIELINGSAVEILSQSHQSVRGTRVHRLRCDEVELFKPDIWQAAQLVTRTETLHGRVIRGSIEAFSTMHRPFGLMQRLVGQVQSASQSRLFQWCALDVAARCQRPCQACPIFDDCRGQAKKTDGFMAIEDLIAQHRRTSRETWECEMLCRRPRRSDCVYPAFDPATAGRHVMPHNIDAESLPDDATVIGGMDFGLRSPLVFLWAVLEPCGQEMAVRIVDEYLMTDHTIEQNLQRIARRPWPVPGFVGVDPAGYQRNSHTGVSDIHLLKQHGYRVRTFREPIRDGIERIRRSLDRRTLKIDPRCEKLIEALVQYHFDADNPYNPNPVKDGPDHLCDALRYMLACLEQTPRPIESRNYLG